MKDLNTTEIQLVAGGLATTPIRILPAETRIDRVIAYGAPLVIAGIITGVWAYFVGKPIYLYLTGDDEGLKKHFDNLRQAQPTHGEF